jgi:hypothetical protein
MSGSTIVALVLLALFILLLLSIFWPRKSPYVRRDPQQCRQRLWPGARFVLAVLVRRSCCFWWGRCSEAQRSSCLSRRQHRLR